MISEDDFRFKINAARYHLTQISSNYIQGSTTFSGSLANQFYYYTDAFLFEAYSACDIILQYLNTKENLGFSEAQVRWNAKFRNKLAEKNSQACKVIVTSRQQPWFKLLGRARNRIAHHGAPILSIDHTSVINSMSIAVARIPPTGESIDINDEGAMLIKKIEEVFESVK